MSSVAITSRNSLQPTRLLVVTDIGRDQDDETTLTALAGLAHRDQVQLEGVVANLQPSDMRARLAKGALQQLHLEQVPVAIGSAAGQANLKPAAHEFSASYMAEPSEVSADGQALLKQQLQDSPDGSNTLLLLSGMTDGYQLVHENPELAKQKIGRVVIMGGVETTKEGQVVLDAQGFFKPDSANNNTFDMPAAQGLYHELQQLEIPTTIVTKNAAYAAAVGKSFYEELGSTGNPVGEHLRDAQKESIDGLWHRVNLAADDPAREGLPGRCDRAWFLNTFCSGQGQEVAPDQSVWGSVTKLNLYDAVALLAADGQDDQLFKPSSVQVGGTEHQIIGLSKQEHGIADPAAVPARLSELAHCGLTA